MERVGWRAPMELIQGEVVVIPPSGGNASLAQTEIVHRLRAWQDAHGTGGRVLTDAFVRVGDAYLAPDVAWWGAGREPVIATGAIETVPELVVEVLSPATRENDLGPKRAQYVAAGVRELWLIDPGEPTVRVVTATSEVGLGVDDELNSSELPGFAIAVRSLFAE